MSKELASIDFKPVIEFVKHEGDLAMRNWKSFSVAEYKDEGRDLSTNLDQEIEKRFYYLCKKHFPGFGFKGEEYPHLYNQGSSEYIWHIDPIDGTKNFAAEVPLWSVTVSLVKNDEPVFGLIYNPTTQQFYSATKGLGAYLNHKRLSVRLMSNSRSQQLAIDFFMPQKNDFDRDIQNTLLAKLYDSFYRVRSIGSGSLSLAWLAQGHFDAYFSWGLTTDKFSDIAAGLIIAKEAGATVEIAKLKNDKAMVAVGDVNIVNKLIDLVKETEVINSKDQGSPSK